MDEIGKQLISLDPNLKVLVFYAIIPGQGEVLLHQSAQARLLAGQEI